MVKKKQKYKKIIITVDPGAAQDEKQHNEKNSCHLWQSLHDFMIALYISFATFELPMKNQALRKFYT